MRVKVRVGVRVRVRVRGRGRGSHTVEARSGGEEELTDATEAYGLH